ncbi:MAG TPA: hypothetical protein VF120_05110 [Ktedonobacterales bacterium]
MPARRTSTLRGTSRDAKSITLPTLLGNSADGARGEIFAMGLRQLYGPMCERE